MDPTAVVDATAYVVGGVVVGPECIVGPGAVVRCDYGRMVLGRGTVVGERAVVHADEDADYGEGVRIGPGAVCHARRVGRGVVVGAGAVVNDGVVLGDGCTVAPGAVVREGTTAPPGARLEGVPARVLAPGQEPCPP